MCCNNARLILIAMCALLLGGCGTAGNQILIFGTDTKYALDISGDATTGQPSFTLGYKRREAVWLPLIGGTGTPTHSCTNTTPMQCVALAGRSGGSHICGAAQAGQTSNAISAEGNLLCVAADAGLQKFVGKEGNDSDAYSVLASFGAKSSTGEQSIAQFIATGIAARKMAVNGGAQLVNTEVTALAKKMKEQDQPKIDKVIAAVTDGNGKVDKTKWDALLTKANLQGNAALANLADKQTSALRAELEGFSNSYLDEIHSKI